MDQYEHADFTTTEVTEELIGLLESAPNGFAAGLIYGKLTSMKAIEGLIRVHEQMVAFYTPRLSPILVRNLRPAGHGHTHDRASSGFGALA